jgi:ribosomal protein S18 acetylase RimI-like enzyme
LTDADLKQILALQRNNLPANLTEERRISQGFVTVQHDLPLLRSMNSSARQIIARDDNRVIGYALVMRPELKYIVPVLIPMFELLETLFYKGVPLPESRYYVMGQICVDEAYRGVGIFDGLYQKHREVFSPEYDYCVTEVSTRNLRSMKAHQRVGFKTIHTFRDETDEWNIVLWDWKG